MLIAGNLINEAFLDTGRRLNFKTFRRRLGSLLNVLSSAIRPKGEFQNGCYKETKHAKFSEKRLFLTL